MTRLIHITYLLLCVISIHAQTTEQPERWLRRGFSRLDSLRADLVVGATYTFPSVPGATASVQIGGATWDIFFVNGDRITVDDATGAYFRLNGEWVGIRTGKLQSTPTPMPKIVPGYLIEEATDGGGQRVFNVQTWTPTYTFTPTTIPTNTPTPTPSRTFPAIPNDREVLSSTETNNRLEAYDNGSHAILNVPGIDIIYNAVGDIVITESEQSDEAANERIFEVTLAVAAAGTTPIPQPTPTPRWTEIDEELSVGNGVEDDSDSTTWFTSYAVTGSEIAVLFQRDSSGSISHPLPLVRGESFVFSGTNTVTLQFEPPTVDAIGRTLEMKVRGVYETLGN